MNIVKDFLKENYPEFKGVIEHTMVAEMAQKYAEHYHTLQLRKTDVIKSVCEIEKEFECCPLFKQYDNGCYGCKYRKQNVL